MDNKKKKFNTMRQEEYTIIMTDDYEKLSGTQLSDEFEELKEFLPQEDAAADNSAEENTEAAAPAVEETAAAPVEEKIQKHEAAVVDGQNSEMEDLYRAYEEMRLSEPGVLDLDDVYPHSYQWRIGDKYDPGKLKVLKEAIRYNKKIEDTDAYERYVEEVRSRKYAPSTWEV